MIPTPEATVGAVLSLRSGAESVVQYVPPTGAVNDVWHLSGGLAPVLGAQEGVIASKFKGLMAPGKPITQQTARADGDVWLDTVYDPMEIDFTATIYGNTPWSFRSIHGSWFDSWSMYAAGRLNWFTANRGEWWCYVRQGKEIGDELTLGPGPIGSQSYAWVAKTEGIPFWRSFDSTDKWDPQTASASGFVRLLNRGAIPSWPTYIAQGPFALLTLGDGLSGATVTFGPLAAGQAVKIVTQPNERSIVEITTSTNLYSLLSGRFATPLPGVGDKPSWARIPVSITGATPGVTSIVAAVTPYRLWPE
ncbi:hypothetical protein [Gordonia sp. N1V]|uniref:hypothetical protein n=1 Tax=Gordonia sp. N1V TaxID=3034163 RepID=UPI0023E27184|nr:hypothetical protein [Gordonia sp. N1V]MDF3280927.1 hypothetical protein [Gordonia sp. N1V]